MKWDCVFATRVFAGRETHCKRPDFVRPSVRWYRDQIAVRPAVVFVIAVRVDWTLEFARQLAEFGLGCCHGAECEAQFICSGHIANTVQD